MKQDLYMKVVLTIIAACLAIWALRSGSVVTEVRAQTSLKCTGQVTANAFGGTQALIGGYAIELKCN